MSRNPLPQPSAKPSLRTEVEFAETINKVKDKIIAKEEIPPGHVPYSSYAENLEHGGEKRIIPPTHPNLQLVVEPGNVQPGSMPSGEAESMAHRILELSVNGAMQHVEESIEESPNDVHPGAHY